MNVFKKLNSWVNYCFKSDGWIGLLTCFIFITLLFIASFGLPLSKFGKLCMYLLTGFSYFALGIGVIRLIKKRKIKKIADEQMILEISARKTKKTISK